MYNIILVSGVQPHDEILYNLQKKQAFFLLPQSL